MQDESRLAELLEMAKEGPALRLAVAEEVADLLNDWPQGEPSELRPAFETLLADTAQGADAATRVALRIRLYAQPALAARLVPRDDPAALLIAAARKGEALGPLLVERLHLSPARAWDILHDSSGDALALACKAMGVDRVVFSTLALLAAEGANLDAYDRVSAGDAMRALRAWRNEPQRTPQAA